MTTDPATLAEVAAGLNGAAALGTAVLAGDADLFDLAADGLPPHALAGAAVLFSMAAEHSLTRGLCQVPQPGQVAALWSRGGDAYVMATAERYGLPAAGVPAVAAWLRAVLAEEARQPAGDVALHLLVTTLCSVDLVACDGQPYGPRPDEWRAFLATVAARVEVATYG